MTAKPALEQATRQPRSGSAARRSASALPRKLRGAAAVTLLLWTASSLNASLSSYDSAISVDAVGGLAPTARMTNAVVLTGANRAAFNFGANSGDVTIEFILEGNPVTGPASAYLAVGANTPSNLRYEQNNNTGQLGFTQLGEVDYLFSPTVASPTQATHVAFVWTAATRAMKLYRGGVLAGTRSGVSANFAMPTGAGWLGANPSGTEAMIGTIHRVTVYDEVVSDDVLQRHADVFADVVRPPRILSFAASPEAVFTPGSCLLSWSVEEADAVLLNGLNATAISNLTVSPTLTTIYTLVASNGGGQVSSRLTVPVNPAPVIDQFVASKTHLAAGQPVVLSWQTRYAESLFLSPGVGDVTGQTLDGVGQVVAQPQVPVTYTLTATNPFGARAAQLSLQRVFPASHLVISEFMAANTATLADEDGQFSGWIEIHNPTAVAASLAGHFLTDEAANPTKWAFPDLTLAPDGWLVVFASGKDRANPAAPLHTSFRLDNQGEYLALVGPGPLLLHAFAPAFPRQRDDVSYGLLGDDPATARFLATPTPGAANSEAPASPDVVQFSLPSAFFAEPFEATLTAPDAGAEIRYTRDGSPPGPDNGAVYSAPIPITNTVRLRAAAILAGQVSPVSGVSYLKLGPDLVNYTSPLPIMVIENFGAGVIPQKGWTGNGSGIKQVPRQTAVWATFERLDGASAFTNTPQMLSLAGIRGRGAYSTAWRQKPFSVEATDERGREAKVSPLSMPAHADWVLYFPDPDANKDPALLFNTFAYDLSRSMGNYAVRFRWVEAFINEDGGELRLADRRGVYAIVEKVSRGQDRLDFQRLSADGQSGSWLLNINRMDPEPETGWPAPNGAMQPWFFHTAGANRILETPPNDLVRGDDQPQQINGFLNFDNPTGYVINPNQRAAIEDWFRRFEDVLYSDALWRDPARGYRAWIAEPDWIDYFVMNVLTRNGDGLLISIFPWKGDDGRLRIGPAWDYNWNAYYISGAAAGSLLHRSERLWYARLFADPDFLQRYIDRWWELRRGPLANDAMDAIIDRQAAEITLEKSLLNGMPSVAEWTNRLGQMKTWLRTRADWIDGNYLRPPTFNQDGGPVPDGFLVMVTAGPGTVYYTTDGADPRASGGAVASSARAFETPFPLSAPTPVLARLKNGTNWSGLASAVFHTSQDLRPLAVTEIMYNPQAWDAWAGEDLEFIELKNTGATTLRLSSLAFTAGIQFAFTNGTTLGPGEFFLLARNPAAIQLRYPGVAVNGVYAGRLDNGGETLRLASPSGGTAFDLSYNDRAPWPLAADGYGFSLVPRDPTASPNSDDGARWRASSAPGGSPGADDPPPAIPAVLINEILSHTDPPSVDAVELFNPASTPADIGGWFLSDDRDVPRKFRIPEGTALAPGSFRVYSETEFNPAPPTLFNFSFDSAGDAVYLVSADAPGNLTGYSHAVEYGAAAAGVSFGRHVNSAGQESFPAQVVCTLGAANAGPRVGPVVIQEIMYHPPDSGDEFIELRNLTGEPVPLFEPSIPTNTWRLNGLGFALPQGLVLPPEGLLLVTATNPAEFRARHSLPPDTLIVGPFPGALQDNGERLELQRPETSDTNGIVYITVDAVRYDDKAPWPPAADGGGPSLQRRAPSLFGDDPAHWTAALPTPGANLVTGEEPVITGQPASLEGVAGAAATFRVEAAGAAPLRFQWLLNGTLIAEATNSTLLLAGLTAAVAGEYQAVVFNSFGSVLSGPALLTVRTPPQISQHPTNVAVRVRPDPTAAPFTNATFTVQAYSAHPFSCQWLFNGAPLPGATNATLTLTNVQTGHWGQYAAALSDPVGTAISSSAWLYPLVRPGFALNPLSQSVAPSSPVSLSAVATGWPPPFTFEWRRGSTVLDTNTQPSPASFHSFIAPAAATSQLWRVVVRTPFNSGQISQTATVTVLPDTDGDGMPDDWELAHSLNPSNALDAVLDPDGDGVSNVRESVAGTDPNDRTSCLKVEALQGTGAALSFLALSNRTYTLEQTEDLRAAAWSRLVDIAAWPSNRIEIVADPESSTNRFYRLVTPRRP